MSKISPSETNVANERVNSPSAFSPHDKKNYLKKMVKSHDDVDTKMSQKKSIAGTSSTNPRSLKNQHRDEVFFNATKVSNVDFYDNGDNYYDSYECYDDFGLGFSRGGGGGKNMSRKMSKRQKQRGGSGNSGSIYSNKHIRAKEAIRNKV